MNEFILDPLGKINPAEELFTQTFLPLQHFVGAFDPREDLFVIFFVNETLQIIAIECNTHMLCLSTGGIPHVFSRSIDVTPQFIGIPALDPAVICPGDHDRGQAVREIRGAGKLRFDD